MKCDTVAIISRADYRFIFLSVFSGGLKKYPSLSSTRSNQPPIGAF